VSCSDTPLRRPPHRILIVEDDEQLLTFLRDLLTGQGYTVTLARNGVEAMMQLTVPSSELPDAILLDLGLPVESGVSVLSFLRTVLRSGAPVIVLTGRDDRDEEAAVLELGVSAYLHKPAPSEEVLAAISQALI